MRKPKAGSWRDSPSKRTEEVIKNERGEIQSERHYYRNRREKSFKHRGQ